jgi:hypothetical protein
VLKGEMNDSKEVDSNEKERIGSDFSISLSNKINGKSLLDRIIYLRKLLNTI